jgi:excisionase family DNA binding protein
MVCTAILPREDIVQHAGQDERITVAEVAERLGISKEAFRKRISRKTLRSEKDADGTVRVYVPSSAPTSGTPDRDGLVETLRNEIGHLRRESERKDTIIMSLSQANAEQACTIGALEAPADTLAERRESSEAVEDAPERAEPSPAAGESSTPAEGVERPPGGDACSGNVLQTNVWRASESYVRYSAAVHWRRRKC